MKTIAVITRTFNRPNYFRGCLASIKAQQFDGLVYHVIVDQTAPHKSYVRTEVNAKYTRVVLPVETREKKPLGMTYSRHGVDLRLYHAPWNVNMAIGLDHVKAQIYAQNLPEDTIILMMDDDDQYIDVNAFQKIADAIELANAKPPFMVFWRVKFPHRLVPTDEHFGNGVFPCDLSTLGFAHSYDLIKHHQWNEFSHGDFRTAKEMYVAGQPSVVWINEALTGLQREKANGLGKADDLPQ